MIEQEHPRGLVGAYTAVDADVHVPFDADGVAAYCDEPHATRVTQPSTFPKDPGSDWVLRDDAVDESDRLDSAARVRTFIDRTGVDHPVLNPCVGLGKLPNDDFAVPLMHALNDYLLTEYVAETGAYAFAELAPQRPEAAAEEIDRLADEDGIVGGLIVSTGPQTPLGDPRFDVMYQTAAKNEFPIAFHGAAGSHFRTDYPKQNQGFESPFGIETLAHLWSQTLTLTSLIVEGTPEKFPDLDLVFLEVGAAWVPYMMWRLNKEYSIQKPQAPLLERSPEQYVRDSCYFTTGTMGAPLDPSAPESIGAIVEPERFLFSSNYPFTTPADAASEVERTFPENRERVFSGTAADVFGIDV